MNKWVKSLSVLFLYFVYTSGFYLLPIYLEGYNTSIFNKTTLSIYFFAADILLMAILGIIYNKEIVSGFKGLNMNKFEFGVRIWIIGMIIMGISNLLISNFSPITIAGNEESVKQTLAALPLYMTFSTALYAPFVEEIIFRQVLRDIIKNNSLFMIVAGLLFGFVHVMDSYTCYFDLLFIIPYGAMGLCFAYIYSKTNNLTVSMILHALHNTLLVITFFLL